jgi:hypothetical protein
MGRALMGGLVFLHRWVGIVLGLLMLMWCLSGVVMIYVSYPSMTDAKRLAALPALANVPVTTSRPVRDGAPVNRFDVEMVNGRPLISLGRGGGRGRRGGGGEAAKPTPDQMLNVARGFSPKATFTNVVKVDQWTLDGQWRQGPLYRYDLHDPAKTWVYVSSQSGRAVQIVNAHERFWNWFGAIPHWLYPTFLRQDAKTWAQVVIWTSLVGTFLAVFGLVLGVIRMKKGKISPYKGWHMWHHVVGLVFGVLLLTWVFSGLLSMNPWGLLEGGGRGEEGGILAGNPVTWATAESAIEAALASPAAVGAVQLRSAPFDGQLYVVAVRRDGSEVRLDTDGHVAPFTADDQARVAHLLFGDGELLTKGDAYYFGTVQEPARFPVLRIIGDDAQATRYYVDPTTGQVRRKVDDNARANRWWQQSLHRLDFAPIFRWRPVWDIMMIVLLLGCSAVCATGLWIGLRRIRHNLSTLGRSNLWKTPRWS